MAAGDRTVRMRQVEWKTMDFGPRGDGEGELRCIRQHAKIERTVEANKDSSVDVRELLKGNRLGGVRGAGDGFYLSYNGNDRSLSFGHPTTDLRDDEEDTVPGQTFLEKFSRYARCYFQFAIPKWWTIPLILLLVLLAAAVPRFLKSNEHSEALTSLKTSNETSPFAAFSSNATEGDSAKITELETNTACASGFQGTGLLEKKVIEDTVEGMLSHRFESVSTATVEFESRLSQQVAVLRENFQQKITELSDALESVKMEREALLSAIRDSRGGELTNAVVQSEIRKAIAVYDADKTGMHDFALDTAGGSVLLERCSETYEINPKSFLGFRISSAARGPMTVIQRKLGPSTADCWAFEGSFGRFTVVLSQRAIVTAVSYEHLPACLSADGNIQSAPRLFQIWGYDESVSDARTMLGEFQYVTDGPALQIFYIQPVGFGVRVIELSILSNYGAHYTCLYRFRVHGRKAGDAFSLGNDRSDL